MPYVGTIISHDPSLHTGLVLPEDSPEAISFTEGDVLNWNYEGPLLGERVRFEIVQVAGQYAAVQMILMAQPTQRREAHIFLPALVCPALLAAATYLLHICLLWPLTLSYVVSINFIALVLMVLIASSGYARTMRPSEYTALLFAIIGGAPAMIFGAYLLPTRFRTEAVLVFLIAVALCEGVFLYRYDPSLFQISVWKNLF